MEESKHTEIAFASPIDRQRKALTSIEESPNIEELIIHLSRSDKPVLLGISLYDPASHGDISEDHKPPFVRNVKNNEWECYGDGHAVVAYDLTRVDDSHWKFMVYDPNYPDIAFPVTVTNENGLYSKACPEWETEWKNKQNKKIYISSSTPAETLQKMLLLRTPQRKQTEPGDPGWVPPVTEKTGFTLFTNYKNFSIFDGLKKIIFKNGLYYSGDMDGVHNRGTIESENGQLRIDLPELPAGAFYQIVSEEDGLEDYQTSLVHYGEDGFLGWVSASEAGMINFSQDGSVQTAYGDQSVKQEIEVSDHNQASPWDWITISGVSNGYIVSAENGKTTVTSDTGSTIDITVSGTVNESTIEDLQITGDGVLIQSDAERNVIAETGSETTAVSFGYSVIFSTNGGSNIPAYKGVESGSLIEAPEEPIRYGARFTGWFKDDDCAQVWDFASDKITEDTVLYAGWEAKEEETLRVVFIQPEKEDQIFYSSMGYTLKIDDCPTISKELDQNWYTDEACTKIYAFDTALTRDLTLYASGKGATKLNSIALEKHSLTIEKNKVIKLSYTLTPGKAAPVELIWESSDRTVANVLNTGEIYTLSAGKAEITLTDTVSGVSDTCVITVRNIIKSGYWTDGLAETYYYTGAAIKPVFTLCYDDKILTEKTDYTITYKNNTKPGTASITVKLSGKYSGTLNYSFTIAPIPLSLVTIEPDSAPEDPLLLQYKKNKVQKPKPALYLNGVKLNIGSYITFTYPSTSGSILAGGKPYVDPGVYEIKIDTKKTAYVSGAKTIQAKIVEEPLISNVTVKANKTSFPFTDAPIEPVFTLTYEKKQLKSNIDSPSDYDYQILYDDDHTDIGKHTVTLKGNDRTCYGERTFTFSITGKYTMTDDMAVLTGLSTDGSIMFSNTGATPEPVVKRKGKELTKNKDYSVSYQNNKKVGSATCTVTGKGDYKGKIVLPFTIVPRDISTLTITLTDVKYANKANAYQKTKVTFKDANGKNVPLTLNKDYTIRYLDTAVSIPTKGTMIHVVITGIGNNYAGTIGEDRSLYYKIY